MKISQREARRLKKRVEELERIESSNNNRWSQDYVGGVHIGSSDFTSEPGNFSAVKTARALGHAVIAVPSGTEIKFYACRPR